MILLTPAEHARLRPVLIERAAEKIRPRLLEDAHTGEDKASARMDAQLLAGCIVDEMLGVLTADAPPARSLAALIRQVA
jgi:hypothetical protein